MRLVTLAQNGYLPSPTVLDETKDVKISKEPQFNGVTIPFKVEDMIDTSHLQKVQTDVLGGVNLKSNHGDEGATIDESSGLDIEIEDHKPTISMSTNVSSQDSNNPSFDSPLNLNQTDGSSDPFHI